MSAQALAAAGDSPLNSRCSAFSNLICGPEKTRLSVDSYTCGLDDRPPFFDLGLVMRTERFGRLPGRRHDLQAQVREALADGRVGESAGDRAIEPGDGLLVSAIAHQLPDRRV